MERLFYKLGEEIDEKIARHINRYNLANTMPPQNSKNILDFGCGSGYGSKLMAMISGRKIIGYDISEEAIDFAKEHNSHKNVDFYLDVLPAFKYDAIILMDMIEHISDEETKETLETLIKLNPKATFIISTPLGPFNGQSETNKYHINCYKKDRFDVLLKKYFKNLEYWLVDWNFYRKMNENESYGMVLVKCTN